MTEAHEANRRYWNAEAPRWEELSDRDGLWRRCPEHPEIAFEGGALETILSSTGELADRDVCIIGSGDNYAAFALAGLGARVTSIDISEEQLTVAARRAASLGLEIDFVRADAADLQGLPDQGFDLVCSTNGFFVWIADLDRVFAEVHRVLRSGGFYVFYDVHPFQRPWQDQERPLQMRKPYWDTGPYEIDGDAQSFEFNWTLADLLNPLARAGLRLSKIVESPAADSRFWEWPSYQPGLRTSLLDWRENPRAGLPVWLTVAAQKA